jgi:hypothetical protein
MTWDLGFEGVGVLLLLSLAFGVFAQLVAGRYTTRRLWLLASGAYLVCGVLISEVWFGWATEEELQPNIDGLSFDEVLLGLIPGIAAVLVIRFVSRRRHRLDGHIQHRAPRSGVAA